VAVLGSQLEESWQGARLSGETIMVARFEVERVSAELRAKHLGDSVAVPEDEELDSSAVQAALRGNAEALKRAARDQVREHYDHLEACCVYGCVDWYQYPDGEPRSAIL